MEVTSNQNQNPYLIVIKKKSLSYRFKLSKVHSAFVPKKKKKDRSSVNLQWLQAHSSKGSKARGPSLPIPFYSGSRLPISYVKQGVGGKED